MALSIMVNGANKAFERVKVFRFGRMEANMKGTGKMIEQMDKEDSSIKMETVIMDNGKTTKPMVEELTSIKIEPSM